MTVCLVQCQRFPLSGADSILIGFYTDDEVQTWKEIATADLCRFLLLRDLCASDKLKYL